jgi:hypothetical protein
MPFRCFFTSCGNQGRFRPTIQLTLLSGSRVFIQRSFDTTDTNRLRIRSTQGRLTSRAAIICGSANPSLAFNKIIARLNLRAFKVPLCVSSTRFCRSWSDKLIRYFFHGISRFSFDLMIASNIPSYSQ